MKDSPIRYRRLVTLLSLLALGSVGMLVQIFNLQVIQHGYFEAIAQEEHWGRKVDVAQRGTIRDRNGHPLAATTSVFDIYVAPGSIKSGDLLSRTAKAVSSLLQVPEDKFVSLHSQAEPQPVLLQANVPYELGTKLLDMGLPGLRGEKASRRLYPEGNLASNLLGLVGKDRQGLMGVEAYYDGPLAGKSGTVIYERDSLGNEIPLGFRERQPPQAGADLFLTIDRYIQRLADKELDQAMKEHQTKSGTIIVMDPQTGAILAMASRPSFDLTQPRLADASQMGRLRSRAVSDMYEPGSTFKIITMAAALDTGKVTPRSTMTDRGYVVKYGWTITNWDGRGNGLVDMTEVLKYSINVGAVWVSDQLGPEPFYKYVKAFGFGQPTNIDLDGEAAGQFRTPQDQDWSPVDLATNSFGQAINVSPLQMVTAVSAVANGGKLMRPYLVDKIVGPTGVRVFRPVEVRRVISPETARTLSGMLLKVVQEGLTKLAMVPGYDMAGKTGTAQALGVGGYSSSTIASFIGYGPIEEPRFIILIKLDEPKDQPWGSVVASPVFRAMAQQMLVYLRVPPSGIAASTGPKN